MTRRENILRAVRFERPDYVPMIFHINPACWHHYDQRALQDLMEEHRFLFPDFRREAKIVPHYAPDQRATKPYTDPWGCVWETTDDGITGAVHEHPLADWNRLDSYLPPDAEQSDGMFAVDWAGVQAEANRKRAAGELVAGELPHGHTFLRLQNIRGYENLLFDMADDEPRLTALIEVVEAFNHHCVLRWLQCGLDMMSYPEDLGMQVGPMLSPQNFRKYIKPVYERLMQPARECGCIVHMHSDGDIRTLVDDLVEGGVEVLNLQDLVNGIDWIAEKLAGRLCIDLDIDRQSITARGTPDRIDRLIREEVEKLGRKEGGLMMIYGLYPGVPLANVRALMDAMERYACLHSS